MPSIHDWESRIAQDEHTPAAMVMLLSDWRAEKTAMIERFKSIQTYHADEIKAVDPRSPKRRYHAIMENYTRAILLALCGENIQLLRGE